jgi:hypothetical protein
MGTLGVCPGQDARFLVWMMASYPLELLSRAAGVFLEKAYPNGFACVPEWKRERFGCLLSGDALEDVLPPSPRSHGFSEWLAADEGLAFRLGSGHFPHLKLRLTNLGCDESPLWIFSVDTHDRMLRLCTEAILHDADAWALLQTQNARLKEEIEHAWESLGVPTHLSLLRRQLESASAIL